MGSAAEFVPFVGTALLFTRQNVADLEDSRVVVPLRLGTELRFTSDLRGVIEIDVPINDDFNDNVGLIIGVNLPF
jgi:hypothetical protein